MRIHREFQNLAATLPSDALRRELTSLAGESDAELRGEGLLSFARRLEARGEENSAGEIYRALAADSEQSSIQHRAESALQVLQGGGAFGDQFERGFRRALREVTDPAALAAMAVGGLAFRATRLAVLGRLAAAPSSLLTRGWMARSAASLAGFAIEAPLFSLSSKLGHQAMGQAQDWSRSAVEREIAGSYLVLGALRLSGVAASAGYRRFGAPNGLGQGLFTQAGMFTGILGAHAVETELGWRPRHGGANAVVDSLITLFQFNAAGRLSQSLIGEGGRNFERELDLRGEFLSRPLVEPRPASHPFFDNLVFSTALPEGSILGDSPLGRPRPILENPTTVEGRPAEPEPARADVAEAPAAVTVSEAKTRGPRSPAPKLGRRSAHEVLRQMLAEAEPLEESAKREVIRRIQSGEQSAKEELIRSDLRYVAMWARRYGFRGEDLLDAIQVGQIGLLEGAKRYDFREGNDFLTYAQWRIRSELTGYARDYLSQVRLPAHQLDMIRTLNNEMKALSAHSTEIDAAELAQRLEVNPKELEDLQALNRSRYLERLDAKRGEDGDFDLHDLLPDKRPRVDEQLVGRRLRSTIEAFIESLESASDRFILHNNLVSEAPMSAQEIAERYGSQASSVKKRETHLLYQLRLRLEKFGVRPFGAEPAAHAGMYRAPRVQLAGIEARSEVPSTRVEAGSNPTALPAFNPRIAIVGFGMAGVGAANALRNSRLFTASAREFSPRITVFEGMNRVGGKVAPQNLGAQFLDATDFYPLDRLIREHGVETTPLREDYDAAPFVDPSGTTLSGFQFSQALRILRQSASEAIQRKSWEELDRQSAVDFIRYLGRQNGPLSSEEVEAMVARLGFEEGTKDVSALSFAVNLAKSRTPMPRYEIVGGIHRLVEAERSAVLAAGGEVRLGTPVRGAQAMADGVMLSFNEGGLPRSETFDYAILAMAPEHFRGFEVSGTAMPIEALTRLEPAHIRKTNLRSLMAPPTAEVANPRFARWNSPDPLNPRLPMVTFFHGWNGEPPLTPREMIREAYAREDGETVLQYIEQIWDGRPQDGIPHYYTTMPQPGTGYAVARFAVDQYFDGRYDAERLRVANHTLGLGCYVRDGALAGELAARSIMRGAGFDVGRLGVEGRDPRRDLLAADKIR